MTVHPAGIPSPATSAMASARDVSSSDSVRRNGGGKTLSPNIEAQVSGLTSALQTRSGPSSAVAIANPSPSSNKSHSGRHESFSMSGMTPQSVSSAMPIAAGRGSHQQPRRESVAGSIMSGMSFGGTPMNSWMREDVLMQGTSPYNAGYQSPSLSTSSYLPKLEANFMKDFSCCGITLASLHDLLQHYEESHTQQFPPTLPAHIMARSIEHDDTLHGLSRPATFHGDLAEMPPSQKSSAGGQPPTEASARAAHNSVAAKSSTAAKSASPTYQTTSPSQQQQQQPPPTSASLSLDMETVEDMEMDDDSLASLGNMTANTTAASNMFPVTATASARLPQLHLNTLNSENPLQNFQGIRQSQPGTPVTSNRPPPLFHHNPTVSSVNTPTLSTHPRGAHLRSDYSPDGSAPGTPVELDPELMAEISNMSMENAQLLATRSGTLGTGLDAVTNGFLFGADAQGSGSLCIDEPGKALLTPHRTTSSSGTSTPKSGTASTGPSAGAASVAASGGVVCVNGSVGSALTAKQVAANAQYTADSDLAKTIRDRQRKAGLADAIDTLNGEPKPFRCPVIGCEKAYKNQNGLKYHKANGHKTQQLQDNADGTYSIVDPSTHSPYPGTMGMEKDKPYKCDTCGKRYKNLNGLKYHKTHYAPCNPEAGAAGPSSSSASATASPNSPASKPSGSRINTSVSSGLSNGMSNGTFGAGVYGGHATPRTIHSASASAGPATPTTPTPGAGATLASLGGVGFGGSGGPGGAVDLKSALSKLVGNPDLAPRA